MGVFGGIEKNQGSKRCWGFPINTTFSSLEHLWKKISNTKIHTVNRQDVEFAMTVYIKAYPCNILSVWVFLAAYVDNTESKNFNAMI